MSSFKKIVKRLTQWIVFSSLHISIAAMWWGVITLILLDAPFNFSLIIIFLLPFFVYTFNRLGIEKGDKINYPERVKFALKYRRIFLVLAALGYIFAISLYLSFNLIVIILTFLPLVSYVVYRFGKKYLLVKNIIIAIVWACAVLLAASSIGILNETVFCFFIFVFLRDFINSIFFDIRDVKGDEMTKIKTLPVVIGVDKTLKILSILNIISGVLLIFFVLLRFLPKFAITLIGLLFYDMFYYYLYRRKNIDKFILFDLIADSEIYFAALLIFIGRLWL